MRLARTNSFLTLAAAALFVFAALPAAASECTMPGQAPVIPDGTVATVDQIKEAHAAVQSYVNLLQSYQDCVEARIKMLSDFPAVQVRQETPMHPRSQVMSAVKADVDIKPVEPEARDVSAVVIRRVPVHVLMLK